MERSTQMEMVPGFPFRSYSYQRIIDNLVEHISLLEVRRMSLVGRSSDAGELRARRYSKLYGVIVPRSKTDYGRGRW